MNEEIIYAIKSLRRSNIRKRIVIYLNNISPNWSYLSEISYQVNTPGRNVKGAIYGIGNSYKKSDSLLCLNIIEEDTVGKDMRLFRITDFGKEVTKSMNNKNNL